MYVSLCLSNTKWRCMGEWCKASHILSLHTGWRWVVRFMTQLLCPQKLTVLIWWNDHRCGKQKNFCLQLAIEICCLANERFTSEICFSIEISYWVSPNYENFVTIVAELTASVLEMLPIFNIWVDIMHHQAWWRHKKPSKHFDLNHDANNHLNWLFFTKTLQNHTPIQ